MIYTYIFGEEVESALKSFLPSKDGSGLKAQHNRAFQQGMLRDLPGWQGGIASDGLANAVE